MTMPISMLERTIKNFVSSGIPRNSKLPLVYTGEPSVKDVYGAPVKDQMGFLKVSIDQLKAQAKETNSPDMEKFKDAFFNAVMGIEATAEISSGLGVLPIQTRRSALKITDAIREEARQYFSEGANLREGVNQGIKDVNESLILAAQNKNLRSQAGFDAFIDKALEKCTYLEKTLEHMVKKAPSSTMEKNFSPTPGF